MKLNRIIPILLLLCTLPAYAAPRLDTLSIVQLPPNRSYRAVRLDEWQRPTSEQYTITVSLPAGGLTRIDLDRLLPAPGGDTLDLHCGEIWLKQTTTGWTVYETRFGDGPEALKYGAGVVHAGVPMPRYMTVGAPLVRSYPLVDGVGWRYPDGGVEMELVELGYNDAQGYLISWLWDAGPSCSLWSRNGKLAGIELNWWLYKITQELPY